MKNLIICLVYITAGFNNSSVAQNVKTIDFSFDCEKEVKKLIDIPFDFETKIGLDSISLQLSKLKFNCGETEFSSRFNILLKISQKINVDSEIIQYYTNEFDSKYRYRLDASKSVDFGFRYAGNEGYFGFLPLKHPLDSLLIQTAKELLLSQPDISKDEKLICLLFSGNLDNYYKELKRNKSQDRKTPNSKINFPYDDPRYNVHFTLYVGSYTNIGKNKFFGTNPVIGISLGSPLVHKFSFDLFIKFRLNVNDKPFDYFALEKFNTVNSKLAFSGGIIGSYKLFETNRNLILGKIGVGGENIMTGLDIKTKNGNSTSTESFDVETLHLSIGFSYAKTIKFSKYIGVGINYHLTPYGWDKNLKTKLDYSALSLETFYRF
jgi:hypothetical protein